MTWKEFCNLAENSWVKWARIRTALSLNFNNPSDTEFLDKSYLVVCVGHSIQIDLKANHPYIGRDVILKTRGILMDSDSKTELLRLWGEIENLEYERKSLRPTDQRYPEIGSMISKLTKTIDDLDLDDLILSDEIQIEVRFPAVNIELIQAVKTHALVDKSKTCMCKACIRVVL
jgi:hypothetical protein